MPVKLTLASITVAGLALLGGSAFSGPITSIAPNPDSTFTLIRGGGGAGGGRGAGGGGGPWGRGVRWRGCWLRRWPYGWRLRRRPYGRLRRSYGWFWHGWPRLCHAWWPWIPWTRVPWRIPWTRIPCRIPWTPIPARWRLVGWI